MKNLLIRLLDLKLSQNTKWRIFIVGFCIGAVVIAGYDVWVTLHPSPKALPLYLAPFEALAFAGLCEIGRRHDETG